MAANARAVTGELELALASPAFHDLDPIAGLDLMLARDRDVIDDALDGHLALAELSRADWTRSCPPAYSDDNEAQLLCQRGGWVSEVEGTSKIG